MRKYSFEFKKKVVMDYLEGKEGIRDYEKSMECLIHIKYEHGFHPTRNLEIKG